MSDIHDDELIADAVERGWIEPVMQGNEFAFFKGENISDVEGLEEAFDQAHMEEVQGIIDGLVEKGFLQTAGIDDNGEQSYELTEHGKRITEEEMIGATQDVIEVDDGERWFIPGHVSEIRATSLVLSYLDENGVLDDYNDHLPFHVEYVRGAWEELSDGFEIFNDDADEPWTVVSI